MSVDAPRPGQEHESAASTEEGDEPSGRIIAGIAGGVAAFFLGWIPFLGPMLGGVVAGFLRGNDTLEGVLVGLLGTVLASIPAVLLVVLFLTFGGLGVLMEGNGEMAVGFVGWILIFFVSFLYFYAFGAIGGAIGAAVSNRRAPA